MKNVLLLAAGLHLASFVAACSPHQPTAQYPSPQSTIGNPVGPAAEPAQATAPVVNPQSNAPDPATPGPSGASWGPSEPSQTPQ